MSFCRIFLGIVAALLLAASPARAVGFQYGSAPDGDDPSLELAIWYPSDAKLTAQPVGLFTQDVAFYGPVTGSNLPLIVISHGTGGSAAGHYDTALALAEAGFVVVAMSHTGDNYKDRDASFSRHNFANRSRHIARVIDFMLNIWTGRGHLDPARIGLFGHSAGGATTLIVVGGTPDFERFGQYCQDHPEAWDCTQMRQTGVPPDPDEKLVWTHDARIKAAAIAAPAVGSVFTTEGLAAVGVPVQLWRAADDVITPNQWNADIIRDALPKPPEDHLVPHAGHFDFLAPCNDALANVAPAICESAPGFDRASFHQDMNKALVAFFTAQLPSP